ncbi:MAG: hypothetical protein NC907_04550, partial [Candidatus Omnitrophica bacterium]|nr:hypothetical protein [Candidatus Omnitrophota bacterium]
TSAIVKWKDAVGSKFTNALGRQFAFSTKIQIAAIFQGDLLINEISQALLSTPITCGDSESCCSIEKETLIFDVEKRKVQINDEIETSFPFPFDTDLYQIKGEGGKIFLVHQRCVKTTKKKASRSIPFKLHMYLFPLKEEKNIIYPARAVLKIKKPIEVYFTHKFAFIPQKP